MLIHITILDRPAAEDTERWTRCGVRFAWRTLAPRSDWHHDALACPVTAVTTPPWYGKLSRRDTHCAACVAASPELVAH
jgi:hypothetical protein